VWWAQVTLTPEDNRMIVLRRGICIGLNTSIPAGGHFKPKSIEGAKLL